MHTGPVRNGPYAGQIKSAESSSFCIGRIYLVREPREVICESEGLFEWREEDGGYWEWTHYEPPRVQVLNEHEAEANKTPPE